MCGINGFITSRYTDVTNAQKEIANMNDLIIHRGPDEDGTYLDNTNDGVIAMAMRRLSIIDLSTGKQPMFSDDKKISIVFNGEIYNYRTLKHQLIQKGVKFNTTSDTEVILKLYEQNGVNSFAQLDGMFAFSIHDKNLNKVFIARDYFGEKPLYYSKTNKDFVFASELKSLISYLPTKPNLSTIGLNLYFRLTYIPAPHSIYDNVSKLLPNHYLDYDLNDHTLDIKEISSFEKIENVEYSFDEAKKITYDEVLKSVESRSIADVSLGTFLSGGVDSSIVSLCLAETSTEKVETFSIGFEKKAYDETDKSKVVANLIGSNHHEFIVKESDFKNGIDEILLNFDEPFADSSAIPTYLVSKHASNHVKVALTGDGGDEVFGGYNKYYIGKLNNKYTSIVSPGIHDKIERLSSHLLKNKDDNRGKRFKINRLLKAIDYTGEQYWNIISLAFTDNEKEILLKPSHHVKEIFSDYKNKLNQHNPKNLNDFRQVDKHVSLEGDMLVKVDRTSMLNSLECRAPFLNKKLWSFTNSLPDHFLLKGWSKKHILKKAFEHKFPKDFLEKSKQGFGVPVGDWLRSSLRSELDSYIEPSFLETQNIFNVAYITNMVNNHISGKEDNSMRVWTFYTFQKWYLNTYSII